MFLLGHEFLYIISVQVGVILLFLGGVVNWQELSDNKKFRAGQCEVTNMEAFLFFIHAKLAELRNTSLSCLKHLWTHPPLHMNVIRSVALLHLLLHPAVISDLTVHTPASLQHFQQLLHLLCEYTFDLNVTGFKAGMSSFVLPQQSCWCRAVKLCATVSQS